MTTQASTPETLSTTEVCTLCGISRKTLWTWQKRGYIPKPTKHPYGHNQHIVRDVLAAVVKNRLRVGPTAQYLIDQLAEQQQS